ncbi:MAG: Ycf66 family protein, partial [Cyanobacteria bacterium P01_A01_bin.15]
MNFGTPVPLLVGLILILGAVGLFFLDKIKPGYERSSDKV